MKYSIQNMPTYLFSTIKIIPIVAILFSSKAALAVFISPDNVSDFSTELNFQEVSMV